MNLEKGRKAIEKYRNASPKHNYDILILDLKKAGFKSIDEFFDYNKQEVEKEIEECYKKIGDCNMCGECCKSSKCIYYDKSIGCKIYNKRVKKGFEVCVNYPTKKDILKNKHECNFKLEEIRKPKFNLMWR